jgi:hypothetical protein
MLQLILLGLMGIVSLLAAYVATREGKFNYEKSVVINASAEKIYPYISNFKNSSAWNSFDQKDPNVKRTFTGTDGAVGSRMDFAGNSEAGAGYLEILSLTPNSEAQIKLVMTKPMPAKNLIIYKLSPESEGTRISWSMSGQGGFANKLVNIFIDIEKMITDDFDKSFQNLKAVVETPSL